MRTFIHYYAISIAALILFLNGFFPVQQNSTTLDSVEPPRFLGDIKLNVSELYKQEINRLVLIVIDALRFDFITQENMPFLMENNECVSRTIVESPTVTLPRIKALTTGNVPQFSDIIFNLANTELLPDSLLHKAKQAGKKIVFYGDDTWLRLFPDVFHRYEGVSSFYVHDYTEVDDNVTRNVLGELHRGDWDIMLLHYLGLDHIGHVHGPVSPLIRPKLNEMDDVISQIHRATTKWAGKTLIAVTGDHGMKDTGGHGGATRSETNVPFAVLGIQCESDLVAQTDIPSSLATLLGLMHPNGNIGRVMSNMLLGYPHDRLLYVLRYNAESLKTKLPEHGDLFNAASQFHYDFLKFHNVSDAFKAKELYERFTKETSQKLVHSAVIQNTHHLLISIGVLLASIFAVYYNYISSCNFTDSKIQERVILGVIIITQFVVKESIYLTVPCLIITSAFALRYLMLIITNGLKHRVRYDIHSFVIFGVIVHSFSLSSSSFIEEEHQVWYFLYSTLIAINCYLKLPRSQVWLFSFLMARLMRNLNQTGDKWSHLPDLAQWLLLPNNLCYLRSLIALSLALIGFYCLHFNNKLENIISSIILTTICSYHIFRIENTLLVKFFWLFTIMYLLVSLNASTNLLQNIINLWIFVSALLTRSHNLILLPACLFMSKITLNNVQNVQTLTLTHIWLGRMLFFCQGHSNSLASVNVASGYVGLDHYMPTVVIFQVLCHTYTFPVLANILLIKSNFAHANKIWTINIICHLLIVVTICILTFIQRYHLFVWTVFAPKLLIEASHCAVLFIQILVFYTLKNIRSMFR